MRFGNIHEGIAQTPAAQAAYEARKAYRNQSTAYLIATRGMIPVEVAMSWIGLAHPMNQGRAWANPAIKMEVGDAYNWLFRSALEAPKGEYQWALTLEEDNIPPPLGVLDLFAAIYVCVDCGEEIEEATWLCQNGHRGLDAISGLYWTKTDPPYPMAYGNPKNNGDELDFRPAHVQDAIDRKAVLEVNGIGMGFALWRLDTFKRLASPWFETTIGLGGADTQDLHFCRRAKIEDGARFAVHCGVSVVHMDPASGRRW